MRICVIAPSEEYLQQAGVRIRYLRIQEFLLELGCELSLQVLDKLSPKEQPDKDVYIFSKCYDARAYIFARFLADAGKLIGVDIFDDYFSQQSDSRFERMREWLRTVLGHADFFLCSTPRMEEVLKPLTQGIPIHVMHDPSTPLNENALSELVGAKIEYVRSSAQIGIAWFGIGDNGHFRVGLWDLAAMGGALRELNTRGYAATLSILTNERALGAQNLEMLKRLPIPFTIDEWSEAGERNLLDRSFACFLPVNAQAFSVAKSQNRCVSALGSGTQIIAPGYPLYRPFEQFLYRNSRHLMRDLSENHLALRPGTIRDLLACMDQWASPAREAEEFARFLLSALIEKRRRNARAVLSLSRIAVIHGMRTPAWAHKLTQRFGHLSIGSPFAPAALNYDAEFQIAADGQLDLILADKGWTWLREDLAEHLVEYAGRSGRTLQRLRLPPEFQSERWQSNAGSTRPSKLRTVAQYGPLMQRLKDIVEEVFPGVTAYTSEFEDYLIAAKRSASNQRARDFDGAANL